MHRDATGLRRLRTDILVDVTDLVDGGYQIEFYPHTAFDPSANLNAPKEQLITGLPWRIIQVRTLNGAVELTIRHVDSALSTILLDKHLVTYDSTTRTWTLESGTGVTPLRTITYAFNSDQSEAMIEVLEGSDVARRTKKHFQTVAGQPEVQTIIVDYGGQNYTTTYA
ncbi:hypothetical protein RZS08_18695, partial [Arthrospira platensis SPKY1]|nr:hypothetical protein [Arthrospira platensis SPKY1]